MAIKINPIAPADFEITYPIVMQHKRDAKSIAIFTSLESGILFNGSTVQVLNGDLIPANNKGEWIPFTGVLKLENTQ